MLDANVTQAINHAIAAQDEALDELEVALRQVPPPGQQTEQERETARALAIAKTNAETARLWLDGAKARAEAGA